MADKQVAVGTLFKTDHNDDASFQSMTLVREVTPPPRERQQIDGMALGDTFQVDLLGIESKSMVELKQFWHPNDSEHEKLDDLFDSKAAFPCQIVTPHGTPVTIEFECKVVSLKPASLTPAGVYERDVTLMRTTAITVS